MQLYFDLNAGSLVVGPLNNTAVAKLAFKRGDSQTISLQFCRGGSVVDLDDTASTGIFGIKVKGDYNGGYIVSDLAWEKAGAGASAVYTFSPSFNTTELNTLIDNGGHPLASVTCMGEIQVRSTAGLITSSNTWDAIILDDVIKGDEGIPTDAEPVYPSPVDILTVSLTGSIALVVGQQDYTADLTALGLSRSPRALLTLSLPTDADDIRAHRNKTATTATSLAIHLSAAPESSESGGSIDYLLIP
ncbi:hypothetical protein SAMN05444156_3270 [Verrucomicrobium sp. GAS474]|uniref:hypothetical protein n=1 Tax=Verrucomicrobium sp. GAS474 TaxID=1882831 RepID=UPI00087A0A6A|nr:hypothetical protein [Verrucomicrobium sp. GAS474]SDU30984.1 hypothetical protein SAMN05444156_3214 [Verrucomicrobium sp. GAS474]SDU31883.1 hypothetical protein SAMN05444156_3270 [Verrucomicrobium sp. GAS474]